MDTLTIKGGKKTMIETKNLEWAVNHPKWVVEHGIFLDNYPGSDDYNLACTSLETVKIEGEE